MWCILLVWACLLAAASLEESYYAQLGVSRQATQQEVRQAYKKLVVKLHPDKNPDDSVKEKFIKITEAYETLKDPERRRRYDLYGARPTTTYERRYNSRSHDEYNKLYHQGLYHDDENVVNLSGKDYNSWFTEEFHFVNFYSPFCPPCRALREDWKQFALLYKGIGTPERWVRYTGARSLHALEQLVLQQLRARTPPPAAPPSLALRADRWGEAAALRIAYHLDGVVSVHRAAWSAGAADDEVTAELRVSGAVTRLRAAHEAALPARVAAALPAPAPRLRPDTLREIRDSLRSGVRTKPVLLYFTREGDSMLPLHKEKNRYEEEFSFGWVECSLSSDLCVSLGAVRPPAWGALKPGGAWQLHAGSGSGRLRQFVPAARLRGLHSLAAHEAEQLLAGEDPDAWLVAVLPVGADAGPLVEAVTVAAGHFAADPRVSFALVDCATTSGAVCRRAAPLVVLQRGRERLLHAGGGGGDALVRLVRLALDTRLVHLDEQQLANVLDPASRTTAWLVAFLPARCVSCARLEVEWRAVADSLADVAELQVGTVDCARRDVPLCANVRVPTVRLLPLGDAAAYNADLEALARAPYMCEWALSRLVPATRLTGDSFDREVASAGPPWLVYFHSPRCLPCYERYAVFALAGQQLATSARLGRVDCLAHSGLCRRERVSAYPTLRLHWRRGAETLQLTEPTRVAAAVRARLPRPRDEL